MPRNVRNWWIDALVDGRKSRITAGPRTKDGGFYLNVFQRDGGSVAHVLQISGTVSRDDNGNDTLELCVRGTDGSTVYQHVTLR